MDKNQIVPVRVQGNHFAHHISQDNSGITFKLSEMFSHESLTPGSDHFNGVIFLTYSGNMYLLSELGLLVNRDQSIRSKKLAVTYIDIDAWLLHTELAIGCQFSYRHRKPVSYSPFQSFGYEVFQNNTSSLKEIVPFAMSQFRKEYICNLPYLDIVERFTFGMPELTSNLYSLMLKLHYDNGDRR